MSDRLRRAAAALGRGVLTFAAMIGALTAAGLLRNAGFGADPLRWLAGAAVAALVALLVWTRSHSHRDGWPAGRRTPPAPYPPPRTPAPEREPAAADRAALERPSRLPSSPAARQRCAAPLGAEGVRTAATRWAAPSRLDLRR